MGEQIGLKWKDIDFDTDTCYVRLQISGSKHLEETKNETRNRKFKFLEPAYQALLKVMPDGFFENRSKYDDELVFKNPRTNDHWKSAPLTYLWRKALKQLKIKYRRPSLTAMESQTRAVSPQ